jgi:uncharacterized protein involved in exopolysaccharide biosynthesis
MPKNNKSLDTCEVDLIDYLKVILKRKFQIFWIFVITIFIIFITTLLMSKTYESYAVLKIGTFQDKEIEAPVEVTKILLGKPTLTKIAQELGIEKPSETFLKRIAKQLEIDNENNIIMINAKDNTPQASKKIALAISNFIIERHKEMFNEKQAFWENRVNIIKNKINALEEEIAQSQNQKIEIEKNINFFNPPANEAQALALQGYLSSLNRVENIINNSKTQIQISENTLNDINLQNVDNKNTYLISEPVLPENPTSPKLKINLIIGGLLGIFLGLFGAFLLEWWQENKKKIWEK